MVVLPPVFTRDPLPADDGYGVDVQWCRVCAVTTLPFNGAGFLPPYTRTVRPDPATGRYVVQPHLDWCPAWTGATPDLPCPRCGAPVDVVESSLGYSLAVPDPRGPGGVGTLVGTAEEVLGHPASVFARGEPVRVPSLDEVTVRPCGDLLRGAAANAVMEMHDELRRARLNAEADVILTNVARLLGAAEAAGHGAVAEAYRHAVRGRTRDVGGLLAALRILCPDIEGERT